MKNNKKKKTISFNVVRLGISKDVDKIPERFNFEDLMRKFDVFNEAEAISTTFNGENLIFQQCVVIDVNERLFHIKVLKEREIDLPYKVKKVQINEEIIQKEVLDSKTHELDEDNYQEISYNSNYLESTLENDEDSFIGEILNILFDAQNNVLVIQNNPNCTTTKGLEALFTALYYQLYKVDNDDFAWINIAPIYNPSSVKDLRKMQTITEISYVIEDNNRIKDANDVAENNNGLMPQKLEVRQKMDGNDKKKGFNKQKVINTVANLLGKGSNLKRLEAKGREEFESNLEILDFIRGNLKFNHTFTLDTNNTRVLQPDKVIGIMKDCYLNKRIHNKEIRSIAMNR